MSAESPSPAAVHSIVVEPSPSVVSALRPRLGAFQFVILASLRAVQLTRGCRPRIDGVHKNTVIARLEVLQGKVVQVAVAPADVGGTLVEA